MKLWKLFFLLVLGASFGSCKDKDCSQADWIGTYRGTIYYGHVMVQDSTEEVTLTVTEDDDGGIIFSYETDSGPGEPITSFVNDCSIVRNASEDDLIINMSATLRKEEDRLLLGYYSRLITETGTEDILVIDIHATRD